MWVAAGDPPRLTKFDPATGERAEVEPLEAPALGIAAAGAAVVVAAAEQSWLHDADTLARVGTVPLGQVRWLAADGEAVWAATAQGAVQRLVGGAVDEAATVGPVAGLTADRRGAWVAIEDDAALRRIGPELRVSAHDPGIDPRTRGGLTACANACWVGGVDELVAVTDDGRRLGPFPTPEGVGRLTPLACVGGAVLGGGASTAWWRSTPPPTRMRRTSRSPAARR